MKHFSYLVTIVLIMMVAISQGFAGKGSKAGSLLTDGQSVRQVQKISDPEIRHRVAKAGRTARNFGADAVAQTSKPIPKVDASSSITSGLSGLYHIPGDFTSIGAAVAVLNYVGVSGAVTFQLDNASYSEPSPITFGAFPNMGTATVTVQPKAGVAVTINFVPTASEGKGFAFNGTDGVTIDGLNTGGASLTLQYSGGTFPASDPFAATIYVTGGSQNVTVQNANIKGEIVTAGAFDAQTDGRSAVFCYQDAGTANADITITGCTITNATFGLKVLSDYNVGYFQGPITFSHNNVGGAFGDMVSVGALMDLVDGMHYDYNVLDGIEFCESYWNNGPTEYDGVATFGDPSFLFDFGQPTAGHMYQSPHSTMNYNWVKDSHQNYTDGFAFIIYGLLNRISGSTTVVQNNRITGVHTTDVDGTDAGLRTESGAVHNSIRLTGAQGAGQTSYCLRAVGGSFYNNALSNERTGATTTKIRCLQGTPGGTSNGNAFYSANARISSAASVAAYFGTGKDANSQYGAIGFDATMHLATFPSSAEDIGRPGILLANDVDGTARDTTGAGVRDAGADEVLVNSGLLTVLDVMPTIISPPNSAGEPFGLPVTPKVGIKNNSTTATGAFNLTLTATDGYSDLQSVSLAPLESKTLTFAVWSPAAAGTYTITATSALAGDLVPSNDILARAQTFTTPATIIGDTLVWNSTSAEGWVAGVVPGSAGASTFVFATGFSKPHITGPYSGFSWVTGVTGVYTAQSGNTVTSPFYNLASLGGDGNVYISFYQALATEPSWDRSWVQYSTNGTTWNNLGVLNDPNGVNWYSTGVYANAAGQADCWDEATANAQGLTTGLTIPAGWTSNGNCLSGSHTGPDGYIYTQLKITPANYPAVVGAPIIKFRFVGFSDGSSTNDGWALDNLRIGGTAPSLAPADVSGNVYTDTDGSGTKNGGETGLAGKSLELKYFGVHVAYDTSDVNGDYNLTMGAPGSYTVIMNNNTIGTSQPATAVYSVAYAGTGTAAPGRDWGLYDGLISGKKFDDLNDNGVDNSEPGLSGWTIELHKDSCNGALVLSGVTVAGGLYAIHAGPGTYYVKEVVQAGWRNTTPLCGGTVVVSGTSGGGSAIVVGPNFGNFHKSTVKLFLGVDLNGNGVYDGGPDNFALPGGAREAFDYKHNGVHVEYDTLGNSIDFVQFNNVDTGNTSFTILGTAPAGWLRTLDFGGTFSVNITTSGQNPIAHFLDFKAPRVTGVKYHDVNGNGVRDGGEPVLAGWTINLTGGGGGSATTDTAGRYTFLGVAAGAHTLSEVVQAGWTKTQPASASYALTILSAGLSPGDTSVVRDFGNFKNFSISGMKFRDRNGNGTKDPGDNGMAGWTINATNGGGAQVTLGSGNYTYSNLGPGSFVLTETAQAGWVQTAPGGGSYTVVGASGVDVTGKDFGNFQLGDSVKYRTWTYAEFKAATEAKPVKKPKVGKPIPLPNSANMIFDLISAPKLAVLQVGLSGQTVGGKEKGWIGPVKQGDVYATFNTKSTTHVGNPRPLSFFNDGIKRILKKVKSLPAGKANSVLFADALTLKINLAASAKGQTDLAQNLGSLIYCEAGHPGLTGKSLNDIAALADSEMTNWDDRGLPGFTAAMWADLDAVMAQINAAFSTGAPGSTGDTATAADQGGAGGWFSPKLRWRVVATAQSTSFLCAPGPGIAPSSNPNSTTENAPLAIPTVYGLNQNYPNPFNPTTVVSFDLPEASLVTLKVYNMLGQEVMTLLNNESYDPGTEEVEFDASALTSGVYFYRITAQSVDEDGITTGNTFAKTMKMILVK